MSPIRPENRSRYPEDWPAIRRRILERAGNRCECTGECGVDHRSGRCPERNAYAAEAFRGRVVLTIAHRDHTPENCAEENLAAWCQRCHLRYDRDHHAATRAETRRRALEAAGQLELGAS